MTKRILAGVLWFLTGAYLWNGAALVTGVADGPGLVLGAVAAFLFSVDPWRRIWQSGSGAAAQIA